MLNRDVARVELTVRSVATLVLFHGVIHLAVVEGRAPGVDLLGISVEGRRFLHVAHKILSMGRAASHLGSILDSTEADSVEPKVEPRGEAKCVQTVEELQDLAEGLLRKMLENLRPHILEGLNER